MNTYQSISKPICFVNPGNVSANGFNGFSRVWEIVTKNIGLYAIACVMYLICGFYIMYPGDSAINAYLPDFSFKYLGLTMGGQDKSYGSYAEASDFLEPSEVVIDGEEIILSSASYNGVR